MRANVTGATSKAALGTHAFEGVEIAVSASRALMLPGPTAIGPTMFAWFFRSGSR